MVSRIPAVSFNITGNPLIFNVTETTSLVVPGVSETIAMSLSAKVFSKELFPTLGGPSCHLNFLRYKILLE